MSWKQKNGDDFINKMTKIKDVGVYKDCIRANAKLESILEDIQRFKISEECTHHLSMYERGQLAQAQEILVTLAHKFRERVEVEELK